MKYDKHYFEKYALLNLGYLCDERLLMLIGKEKMERPDWQSEELDIGIEVVRTLFTSEGREDSIINRYFGKGLEGRFITNEVKKLYPDYKNLIKIEGESAYTSRYYDMNDIRVRIESQIEKKTKLLNSGYRIYKDNWLYVFTGLSILNMVDIEEIIARIEGSANSQRYMYNKIFINVIDRIFVVKGLDIIEEIEIPSSLQKQLKKEAVLNSKVYKCHKNSCT